MTQTPQSPEPIENRVSNLERSTSDLRITAEALLQAIQIHQTNFETIAAELQTVRQRQQESDQRFEIILSDLRQMKIDSDVRFAVQQAEIRELQLENRRILDRLFPPPENN
ncbi:hypothetical protein H6F67_18615 [Microcoleus sp. FACHB-1515]|uniref:hypothetical protein n=1 Tax=Cyanophyceae TaxID=3028117 RepID=UPI001684C15E|nr:hypothetical protein [Microcoleus sp. FACHB-1515]MBD2091860.1 hypothetical protein [Microcoleus sp. FACHB-1515]